MYSEDYDEQAWSNELLTEMAAMADTPAVGAHVRLTTSYDEQGTFKVDDVVPGVLVGAVWKGIALASMEGSKGPFGEAQFGRTRGSVFSQVTGVEPAALPGWRQLWPEPVVDLLGVITRDTSGHGSLACVGLPAMITLDRRESLLLGRLASHIAAADRLRRAEYQRPLDEAEAIFSPRGKLLHAEPRAEGALEALADARERRSFALKSSDDAERALDVWQGLAAGRWSLVDHFDSDGKRLLVAMKNIPKTVKREDLAPKERRVLSLVAMGHADKEIAYSLGISMSSVSGALRTVREKTGIRSRVALASWWRAGESREGR